MIRTTKAALYGLGSMLALFGGVGLLAGTAGLVLGEFHGPIYSVIGLILGVGFLGAGVLMIQKANHLN